MAYKYPFIPDKRMYAAVMGACKYIRETGYFNKAVQYNADKFGVDPNELEKEIRKRQSAGQKGKSSKNAGSKQHYFIVVQTVWTDANGYSCGSPQILRGVSKETVEKRFVDSDFKRTVRNDYGGSYAPSFDHVVAEFASKNEAEEALPNWIEYVPKQYL